MNMNFQTGSCPVCGQIHDDGGWITRETGERQFICHDCLDTLPVRGFDCENNPEEEKGVDHGVRGGIRGGIRGGVFGGSGGE